MRKNRVNYEIDVNQKNSIVFVCEEKPHSTLMVISSITLHLKYEHAIVFEMQFTLSLKSLVASHTIELLHMASLL